MFRIDRRIVNLSQEAIQADMPGALAPGVPAVVTLEVYEPEEFAPEEAVREDEAAEAAAEPETDVREAVSALIEQAEAEAAAILAAAREQAGEIREQARAEGLAAAQAEAQRQLERELGQKQAEDAAMVGRLLNEIGESRERMIGELESDFVELSLAIAKKIINVALKKDDTIFESMLKKALQQMKCEGRITLRVSGEEYERFFSAGSATFVLGDSSITATVLDDPSVPPGGAIIESDGETINAGVDSQLGRIELAFGYVKGQ